MRLTGREFDGLIDDTKLAAQALAAAHANAFYTVDYPIPAKSLKGKASVTVNFRTTP